MIYAVAIALTVVTAINLAAVHCWLHKGKLREEAPVEEDNTDALVREALACANFDEEEVLAA